MFRGLCGDSRECGEVRTPAVKRGARELHRAPSGHCGVGSDLRLIAAGARGQKVDVIHRNRTNRYYTYPAAWIGLQIVGRVLIFLNAVYT